MIALSEHIVLDTWVFYQLRRSSEIWKESSRGLREEGETEGRDPTIKKLLKRVKKRVSINFSRELSGLIERKFKK